MKSHCHRRARMFKQIIAINKNQLSSRLIVTVLLFLSTLLSLVCSYSSNNVRTSSVVYHTDPRRILDHRDHHHQSSVFDLSRNKNERRDTTTITDTSANIGNQSSSLAADQLTEWPFVKSFHISRSNRQNPTSIVSSTSSALAPSPSASSPSERDPSVSWPITTTSRNNGHQSRHDIQTNQRESTSTDGERTVRPNYETIGARVPTTNGIASFRTIETSSNLRNQERSSGFGKKQNWITDNSHVEKRMTPSDMSTMPASMPMGSNDGSKNETSIEPEQQYKQPKRMPAANQQKQTDLFGRPFHRDIQNVIDALISVTAARDNSALSVNSLPKFNNQLTSMETGSSNAASVNPDNSTRSLKSDNRADKMQQHHHHPTSAYQTNNQQVSMLIMRQGYGSGCIRVWLVLTIVFAANLHEIDILIIVMHLLETKKKERKHFNSHHLPRTHSNIIHTILFTFYSSPMPLKLTRLLATTR